jgi:rRNA maturation endonuclease Nob1
MTNLKDLNRGSLQTRYNLSSTTPAALASKIKENEKCYNLTSVNDKLLTLNEVEQAQLQAGGGDLVLERHGLFYLLNKEKSGQIKVIQLNKYIGVSGNYDNSKRCPLCNTKVSNTQKFCGECGHKLDA